ncbi:MAG: PIN domain-containing protein [Candidatus Firestonebacteria bacterium]
MPGTIAKYRIGYLIDTNIIINILNKNKRDFDLIFSLEKKEILSISVLTIYELFIGIHDENVKKTARELLKYFKTVDITSDICEKASEIMKQNKQLEDILGIVDLLLAATCILHKLILITENKKHFKLIPEIEIYEK